MFSGWENKGNTNATARAIGISQRMRRWKKTRLCPILSGISVRLIRQKIRCYISKVFSSHILIHQKTIVWSCDILRRIIVHDKGVVIPLIWIARHQHLAQTFVRAMLPRGRAQAATPAVQFTSTWRGWLACLHRLTTPVPTLPGRTGL